MKRRLYIIVTAPLEIVGVALIFAWRGAKMGAHNVRDAWHNQQFAQEGK